MALATALDCCDERLGLCESAEIDECCEAGRGEGAGSKTQSAPECKALPQTGAGGLRGQGAGNAIPNLLRRKHFRNLSGPGRETLLPGRDLACEAAVMGNALLGGGSVDAVEHAQRILGREQFVFGQAGMVECIAHCSRHAFSLNMARRIQLFIVPSGTLMRVARSS